MGNWIEIHKTMWKERKTYKYIKCDRCEEYFRVPRGKGTMVATCPHCQLKLKICS